MRLIATILLLFFYANAYSVSISYYVSSSTGNDANSGTDAAHAWQTINKVNASFSTFKAGDFVLFKTDDTFFGTLTVNKSGTSANPITISSYGAGAKPIITGFVTISGWTNEGGGIYSKVIATSSIQTNMVTINGVQYAMGRFPDTGWLTYESATTNTSITDNTLGTSTIWTGAEAAIRKTDWDIDRCLITNHTGNTLTYTSKGTTLNATPNFGFFIQNDIRCVTNYGEWYHDITTNKFYMYFGGIDPNTVTVKAATLNYLFVNNGGFDYIVVDGISFVGSIDNTINTTYAMTNCTFKNDNIFFSGKAGIIILDQSDVNDSVYNCNLRDINKTAIATGATNMYVNNNQISNVGVVIGQALGTPGIGLGDGGYDGIFCIGLGAVIRNNYIHNTGWNGMTMKYLGASTIQYNFIDTVCTLLKDGGGIYSPGPDTNVRLFDHNVIINALGGNEGAASAVPNSAGIYLDENASNVTVSWNYIESVTYGVKLHKASSNNVVNNTTFDATYGIIFEDHVGNQIRNNRMFYNNFIAKTAGQYVVRFYYDVANDITLFGTADSNYYLRPINDNTVFLLRQPSLGTVTQTLAQWQAFSSQDAHSKKSPKTITNTNQLFNYSNPTTSVQRFNFTGFSRINDAAVVYDNLIDILPYEGTVLIDNGVINQPPVVNAGADQSITLPTNSVSVTATAIDPESGSMTYRWTIVSGAGGTNIASPTSLSTNITFTVAGKYTFQFAATDNGTPPLTGADLIVITVNPTIPPPNTPPTANAGVNQTRQLPSDTITLFGSGTDSDGSIVSYHWDKLSGSPAGGTIANANVAYVSISALQAGIYRYSLTVTDNGGLTDTSVMVLTVLAAPVNQRPTAYAGADQIRTLPSDTVTLFGSGTDPDGTISSFSWSKQASSPSGGNITSPTSATTGITGLLQGTYRYDLIVTDNGGLKDTSTVTITVNAAPPNIPPVVSLGAALVEITLPVNSTTLSGSATDDGSISGYSWTQISGANTATIGTPSQTSTTVSGLIQGQYVFRFTATDNKGLSSFKDATVNVLALPVPNQKYLLIWWH